MRRAAIFDDAQAAGRDSVLDPVVEKQHAIRHIFFETMPGERAVATLGGDDRGEFSLFQPIEQPTDFGAQNGRVGKSREKAFDRVEHDPFGADLLHSELEPNEQSLQIVIADLSELGGIDRDMLDVDSRCRRSTRRGRSQAMRRC